VVVNLAFYNFLNVQENVYIFYQNDINNDGQQSHKYKKKKKNEQPPFTSINYMCMKQI
jgi:hypothetical protein